MAFTASLRGGISIRKPPPNEWVSNLKSFLAQPAVRAVADVQPDQLVAAAAGAEVLGAARQRRDRGREREDLGDRLHLLAGLAIDVAGARLGVGDRLATGGRGAHAVELLLVHRRED